MPSAVWRRSAKRAKLRTTQNRETTYRSGRKVTRQDLREAAEKYKNWGKWGPDDEIGTLNYTSPEDIIAAASS